MGSAWSGCIMAALWQGQLLGRCCWGSRWAADQHPCGASAPFCCPWAGTALVLVPYRKTALNTPSAPARCNHSLLKFLFLMGWKGNEDAAAPIPRAALATLMSAFLCGKGILNLFISLISGGLVVGIDISMAEQQICTYIFIFSIFFSDIFSWKGLAWLIFSAVR